MSKNKKIVSEKRTIDEAIINFGEDCEFCKHKLTVVKFKEANHKREEVITATCFNTNFKDWNVKCELYGILVKFRACRWF